MSLGPRQQEVFDLIARHQPIARGEIAKMLGISLNTVGNHCATLRALGLIEPTSTTGRWSTWRISQKQLPPSGSPLKPYERAASVWQYAERCRRKK